MNETSTLTLRPLSVADAGAVEGMTFPIYRPLLALQPVSRHPELGDPKIVQPIGIAAWREGQPVGLVMAETPTTDGQAPEMLSLFVAADARGQGVATALVAELERVLRAQGQRELRAVYMTGKPAIDTVEHILARLGWAPPVTRSVTLRFTPEEALSTPWFGRIRLPEPEYQAFPWTDITPDERAELERSHAEKPWITKGLEFWNHDRQGFDPVSSIGLRHQGRIVGWVINHRLSADTVRFTCSFMRKDLGRRGRIMPLYTVSLELLRAHGPHKCMFVTPVQYQTMVDFVKRRCAPWATFFGETRGVAKNLV
jgi:GNAT superfamily N-acetyltransferase